MADIYGGGSPTGIAFYENGALGDKWTSLLLSAEAGKNVIFGYQPKMKGATYQLNRNDFCTTNPKRHLEGSDFVGGRKSTKPKNWTGKERPTQLRPSDVMVSAVKAEASYWLLKPGTGEWKEFNLMPELAKRDIYNPAKIKPTATEAISFNSRKVVKSTVF